MPSSAKAFAMAFDPNQTLSPGNFGRTSKLLLSLFLSTTMAVSGSHARASDVGDAPAAVHPPGETRLADENGEAKESDAAQRSAAPTTPDFCEALATAATTNDLPVDFFTRLIWHESRFKPDAVSSKGAQGIAQFMPRTARLSGLADPFNPFEAIAKSGQLLRELRREFGNLGLAAAAYNAGSGRVRDWIGRRRPLPLETRAYVRLVTGRSIEGWTGGQTDPVEMPSAEPVPCNLPGMTVSRSGPDLSPRRPETIKPWGVQVVGGPTPAKALARYREWLPKYAAVVGDREPHVVAHGIAGQMGAALVRVGEETRAGADKLCAALRAAGTYCDVLRN